jgi:hypothetical protein
VAGELTRLVARRHTVPEERGRVGHSNRRLSTPGVMRRIIATVSEPTDWVDVSRRIAMYSDTSRHIKGRK